MTEKKNENSQSVVVFPVQDQKLSKDFEKFLKSVSGKKAISKDQVSETKHSISIGGKKINYTARAGFLPLTKSDGTLRGHLFYVSYTKSGTNKKRPITYCFNGGPGSSSVWLHMGAFGPKRVKSKGDGSLESVPGELENNPHSLLDVCDLVFIDPVGTGLSRAQDETHEKDFLNVQGDIESVGDFIYNYTNEFSRWDSPKYISGESYGTTRASGLASYLQDRYGMYLNGLVLLSIAMDFQTLLFNPSNDLPYPLLLPTFAATAWFHKTLKPNFQKKSLKVLIKEAEEFALNDYNRALFYGDRLSEAERKTVVKKLSDFTSLKEETIERLNLRITVGDFQKHLLIGSGHWVGRLDTRYKGEPIHGRYVYEKAREGWLDPGYYGLLGLFSSTFHHYLKTDLKFEIDESYDILSFASHMKWDWSDAKNNYTTLSKDLAKALIINPQLKVFVANGYYDMATPHLASEYTFDHMGLAKSLRKNVTMHYYESGHMMYIHEASHKKLKKDLLGFFG